MRKIPIFNKREIFKKYFIHHNKILTKAHSRESNKRTEARWVWIKYSMHFGNRTEPNSAWGLYRREIDESSFSLEWLIQGWEESFLRPGSEESNMSYDWRWQQPLWPTETFLQLRVIIVMIQTRSQLTMLHTSSQATSYTWLSTHHAPCLFPNHLTHVALNSPCSMPLPKPPHPLQLPNHCIGSLTDKEIYSISREKINFESN